MEEDIMRKFGKKLLAATIITAMLCCGATGCGVAGSDESVQTESSYNKDAGNGFSTGADTYSMEAAEEVDAEEAAYDDYADAEEKSADVETQDTSVTNKSQKIIKRYYYESETEAFDTSFTYLKESISKYNGYITSSEVDGTSERRLHLTARVPAEVSDTFVNELGNLGTVVSQSETAEDVTLQYSDTESRIESLKVEQKRLNELLEKAESLENIIALEDRLTEVRYELESYQSQKNMYDDLITYSTINITLKEVNYTVVVDDSTFISRIVTGLKATFRDIKNDLADFVVWLIVTLPYILIWSAVIFIIVKVIRRLIRRRHNKKKNAEAKKESSEQIKQ